MILGRFYVTQDSGCSACPVYTAGVLFDVESDNVMQASKSKGIVVPETKIKLKDQASHPKKVLPVDNKGFKSQA
jgi:hypothetical protein